MLKKKTLTVILLSLLIVVLTSFWVTAEGFDIEDEITFNLQRGSTLEEAFIELEEISDNKILFHLDPEMDLMRDFRLSIKDTSFESVLNLILQLNNLEARQLTDELYHIYPREKHEEYRQLDRITTRAYRLKEQDIDLVIESLEDIFGRQVDINLNEAENIIFVTADEFNFDNIESIIEEIKIEEDIEYIEKIYDVNMVNINEAAEKLKNLYDIPRIVTGENSLFIKHRKDDTESIENTLETLDIKYIEKEYEVIYADVNETIEALNEQYGNKIKNYTGGENSLVIKHREEISDSIEKAIATMDSRNYQVEIDVTVFEFSHTKLQKKGVEWTSPSGRALIEGITGNSDDYITYPFEINLSEIGTITEVISNPQIRAENYERSNITIGEQVPIVSGSAETGWEVEYRDVGIILNTTPYIHNEDELTLDVDLAVEQLGEKEDTPAGSYYRITSRQIDSKIILEDESTVVFGGLMNEEERIRKSKVPGLSGIPLLGNIFERTVVEPEKTEIVMLISPNIIELEEEKDTDISDEKDRIEKDFREDRIPFDYNDFK